MRLRWAVGSLPTNLGVPPKLWHPSVGDGLLDNPVGSARVDHDPVAVDAHLLERVLQLALRVVGHGDPTRRARHRDAVHRARVGAVSHHLLAVLESDVGKEALVASQKRAIEQRLAVGQSSVHTPTLR